MGTLYDRLGVDPLAEPAEIHAAWRRVVRTVHPDLARDQGDAVEREALTAAVNEAYTILADPELRADYDRSLPWRARPGLLARVLRRLRRSGGARRWRPGLPHPTIPAFTITMPDPGPLIGFGIWFIDARLGQWLLVLGAALGAAVWGGAISAWCIGLAVAVLLARGGAPTPLYDAGAILWPLAGGIGGVIVAALRALFGSIAGSLSERIEEARTSGEEMERITEQEREALGREGIRTQGWDPGRTAGRPLAGRRRPSRARIDWGDGPRR